MIINEIESNITKGSCIIPLKSGTFTKKEAKAISKNGARDKVIVPRMSINLKFLLTVIPASHIITLIEIILTGIISHDFRLSKVSAKCISMTPSKYISEKLAVKVVRATITNPIAKASQPAMRLNGLKIKAPNSFVFIISNF